MEMDSIYRGGGPIFYRHFSYNLSIENNARQRDRSDLGYDSQGAAARYALQQSNFRPGDVLFLSSVSGRTKHVVDLASPEWKELAGRAKDAAAGGVLVVSLAAAIVGLVVFIPKLVG